MAFCRKTGYRGRIAIFELLVPNPEIVDLILKAASSVDIKRAAISAGMKTLREQGLIKVIEGITSLEEILLVAAEGEGSGGESPDGELVPPEKMAHA